MAPPNGADSGGDSWHLSLFVFYYSISRVKSAIKSMPKGIYAKKVKTSLPTGTRTCIPGNGYWQNHKKMGWSQVEIFAIFDDFWKLWSTCSTLKNHEKWREKWRKALFNHLHSKLMQAKTNFTRRIVTKEKAIFDFV